MKLVSRAFLGYERKHPLHMLEMDTEMLFKESLENAINMGQFRALCLKVKKVKKQVRLPLFNIKIEENW